MEKKRALLPLDLRKNPQAALAFIEKLMLCPGSMFQHIYLPWHVRCPSSRSSGWKHVYFQVGIELLSNNLSWGACAEAQKQNHCRVVLQVLQGKQTNKTASLFVFGISRGRRHLRGSFSIAVMPCRYLTSTHINFLDLILKFWFNFQCELKIKIIEVIRHT